MWAQNAQRPLEHCFKRQARLVLTPTVRDRGVEEDVRAEIRGHESFAQKPGTKVGNDHWDRGIRQRDGLQIERVAKANVERTWQSQLLAHADRQHTTMNE